MAIRFGFGDNWLKFVADLKEEQIVEAQESLQKLLGRADLSGLTFLDIGSGSGLSSLQARRRGARVRAFDFDPESVASTQSLRDKYFFGDDGWTVERGSILDASFTERLGTFDIAYSWGVLHSHRCDVESIGAYCEVGRAGRDARYRALPQDTALRRMAY